MRENGIIWGNQPRAGKHGMRRSKIALRGEKRCNFEQNKKLYFFNKFSQATGIKIWRNDNLLVSLQVKRGRGLSRREGRVEGERDYRPASQTEL